MRKIYLLIMISCLTSVVTGCGGAKEIQNQAYITAVGLDYVKGEYRLYTQALNFSNIAKQEGGTALQQSSPILIGQSKGKSIQAAKSALEQNTAIPLYYGHVNTILLSKNVIEKKLGSVIEFIGQNPFLRYNCWLYGTNDNIKDIFLSESFFNYPSLFTILHRPKPLYKENFFVPVEKYNQFISKYYQPVGSYIIPSIKIKQDYFLKNRRPKKVASLDGGFVITQHHLKGWAAKENLAGLKWFSKNAADIPLSLFKEKVSVVFTNPHASIKVINGPKPNYDLIVKADAAIFQNEKNMSINKIEKELAKTIKNEIVKTLDKSDEMQADLLNLSEKPYRYKREKWDLATINAINKNLVKHIEIKVKIDQNVTYKR